MATHLAEQYIGREKMSKYSVVENTNAKNVIFDIGNVIVAWQPYRALGKLFPTEELMNETLDNIGFYEWNHEQDRGRSWEEGLRIIEAKLPEYAHIFHEYKNGLVAAHSQQVVDTTAVIIELHRKGVGLYGITNAAHETFEIVKNTAPVLMEFKDIIVSSDVGYAKPDLRIYDLCVEKNSLKKSETIFVDDVYGNCEAAHSAGISAYQFKTSKLLKNELIRIGLL